MATLIDPPRTETFAEDSRRVVLCDVPWEVYAKLRDVDANRHVRMSYNRGVLELMSPQFRHERSARRLELLIRTVAAVWKISCTGAGSTTFQRPDLAVGKEADTCFYIAHEPAIRDKDEIDLTVDPPPDLAIEVDNQNDSRGKLPIYAALGVPEVWRYDARRGQLWIGRLQGDGTYTSVDRSEALPLLTVERVSYALGLCHGVSESAWMERLREWASGLTA